MDKVLAKFFEDLQKSDSASFGLLTTFGAVLALKLIGTIFTNGHFHVAKYDSTNISG